MNYSFITNVNCAERELNLISKKLRSFHSKLREFKTPTLRPSLPTKYRQVEELMKSVESHNKAIWRIRGLILELDNLLTKAEDRNISIVPMYTRMRKNQSKLVNEITTLK